MKARTPILFGLLALVVIGLLSSIFIVTETQKALVLQFGRVVSIKEDPGLSFKIPAIQNVVYYDDRIIGLDTSELEITPLDDRRLVVDAFATYRVNNPVQLREAAGASGIAAASNRLDNILRANIRQVLGSVSSNDILSVDRAKLMLRIRDAVSREAQALGLEIIDVRLKRTDLPKQNLEATFARMRAEREREAADQIARGEEAAQRVRAQSDRTVVELESDARKKSEIARGEADAKRNAIFATAYGADQEFFAFYRSLSAYEKALKGTNSTIVLSPDSDFFNYLNSDRLPAK